MEKNRAEKKKKRERILVRKEKKALVQPSASPWCLRRPQLSLRPFCARTKWKRGRQFDITFISLVGFPEINDGNWFEVEIPQPDTAVSAPSGEALFTYIHAENSWLEEMRGCQYGSTGQMSNDRTSPTYTNCKVLLNQAVFIETVHHKLATVTSKQHIATWWSCVLLPAILEVQIKACIRGTVLIFFCETFGSTKSRNEHVLQL